MRNRLSNGKLTTSLLLLNFSHSSSVHDAKVATSILFQVKVAPQKEPEKEKKTEIIPSPAANHLKCETCGKVYHTRHAYHFRNHLLTCGGTMGLQEQQKTSHTYQKDDKNKPRNGAELKEREQQKNAVEIVATPVTPSSEAVKTPIAASPRTSYDPSDLAGTCTNCGKQYLKRHHIHYQSHILK